MPELRIPKRDLVADLVNLADPSLGDAENICRALPRHLRLYVCAHMMWSGEDTRESRDEALRDAYDLYDSSGTGLLDQQRRLTTADIVAEVLQLLGGTT